MRACARGQDLKMHARLLAAEGSVQLCPTGQSALTARVIGLGRLLALFRFRVVFAIHVLVVCALLALFAFPGARGDDD